LDLVGLAHDADITGVPGRGGGVGVGRQGEAGGGEGGLEFLCCGSLAGGLGTRGAAVWRFSFASDPILRKGALDDASRGSITFSSLALSLSSDISRRRD